MSPTVPTPGDIERFLAGRHRAAVSDLEPLTGGFWSSAYGYQIDGSELVARFGTVREGFEMDRAAMAYDSPGLPVPAVFEIGDAFGGAYAISERRRGRFLEDVRPDEAPTCGPTLVGLLAALRAVPSEQASPSWRRWLLNGLVDDPAQRVSGWRTKLAADAHLDRLFAACEGRIRSLTDACPERRDLVHGDLLHGNVLISEDASRVNAVFSWKCSARGDHLFDVAWCTFWGEFHPGIAAIDAWGRVMTEPSLPADPGAVADAATRHHCYELHIGATHLGWNAWVGDEPALRAVADHTAMILERGPLPLPSTAAPRGEDS